MKTLFTPIISFAVLFLSSCDVINPDEQIPTIVVMDQVSLTTTADQGANTHDIEDLWVISNGELGVFPLPSEVPILGMDTVFVRPGIRPDGRASSSLPYPHYQIVKQFLNLQPGQKINMPIDTRYRDETKFVFVEDFENGVEVFINDLDTILGGLDPTAEDVRSGLFSGRMDLSESQPIIGVNSPIFTNVLDAESSVFLEMDYKNEEFFTVTAIYHTPTSTIERELLTFNRRETWNKVYLNVTDIIRAQAVDNIVGMSIAITTGLVEQESASIWLDNIKLIYE